MPEQTSAGSGSFLQYLAGNLRRNGRSPVRVYTGFVIAWALFFIVCGLANIYIAFWLPQNIWVNFKVFGLTALTLLFTLLSGIYIYRHLPQEDKS